MPSTQLLPSSSDSNTTEPLHVIATTSSLDNLPKSAVRRGSSGDGSGFDENHETISFQYPWSLRVCQRLLENNEAAVLNVSPPFTTSFNGVQFTWALRLSDECVVSQNSDPSVPYIFIHIYYKDGPCQDVIVEEAKAHISCSQTGEVLFSDLQLGLKEFTKGSGWPLKVEDERQSAFTCFIQQRIDCVLNVVVTIKLKTTLFEPFNYLPDVETSQRIERHCLQFIQNVQESNMIIPEADRLVSQNKFSMHRLVFLHGCDLVERECSEDRTREPCEHFLNLVRSTFARVYFNKILMKEVECLEDFVTLLEGVIEAHIPPLRRELERFICQEVLESTDSEFTKKMLLLSQKFSLDVLKMVATGALVDQIIAHSNPPAKLANITHDLKQFASEMDDQMGPEVSGDVLVGSVVEDLQSLTRRVRRVSLSHSPSVSSQGSSPVATPSDVDSLSPAVSDQRPFDQGRFKKVEIA
ncbi:unnamed protein product [Auanema sp. JU1783]|nr:unnamed protein product [Auanema sp. JU1783]